MEICYKLLKCLWVVLLLLFVVFVVVVVVAAAVVVVCLFVFVPFLLLGECVFVCCCLFRVYV